VQVTWEELAEHNTPQDLWVAIRGKVYDLTTYQNRHPGGFRLMQLGAGRDVTHLFEAYHPLRCERTQERVETLPSSSCPSLFLSRAAGPDAPRWLHGRCEGADGRMAM